MNKPPSTKEILGEHLHQKVKEVQSDDLENGLVNKITGILLEKPVEDIYQMLTDGRLLQSNVKIARECVNDKRDLIIMEDEGDENLSKDEFLRCIGKSCQVSAVTDDTINEILYQRVYELEPCMAPQITGMLLELDPETLSDLLRSHDKFFKVFLKARSCLTDTTDATSRNDLKKTEDSFSHVIYTRAKKMYGDYAPKITGMILELDEKSLEHVLKDDSLDTAIVKAYNALMDSSSS